LRTDIVTTRLLLLFSLAATVLLSSPVLAEDVLPSWRAGAARDAILEFVEQVTDESGPHFVPPKERVATFDNDGTLWAEQPVYFQLFFTLDRVRAMAPEHPEWKTTQPFQSVLENDMDALMAGGEESLIPLLLATHTGMTTDEFSATVSDWLATAVHPVLQRPYTDLVYQPMLELLDYLRDHGFHTYITSGGGIEFMRPWVEAVYGIPPEQVIGSSLEMEYEVVDGKPVLRKLPELHFFDDKEGKPIAIQRFIGRRPIASFGNSDGDFQMLEWTAAGDGLRLAVYVHHTDADREWAYDRDSHIGRLDRGLNEAPGRGWIVVDMKRDWEVVFPFELEEK